MTTGQKPHRVVVVGGFEGLQATLKLSRMPVEVTPIDRLIRSSVSFATHGRGARLIAGDDRR